MSKLGILSLILGVGSLGLSLLQGVVQEKEQDEIIDKKVAEKFEELNKGEESK